MNIKKRRYKILADFNLVSEYLDEVYNLETLNSHLLRPFFEYAHTHPMFEPQLTHRFSIWEDNKQIVVFACYEMNLGECFLSLKPGYEDLLEEMLYYSERELSLKEDSNTLLRVWVTEREKGKRELLATNGYKLIHAEPVTIFSYSKKFPEIQLPGGFVKMSLAEENDLAKIHACLWQGFDHGPNPDDDLDSRMLMQSGPNFSKELTTVIKAPSGDYACFAGMWYNLRNRYAYIEPLATVPAYRGKGLAAAAVTESMKKTKALGAENCFGGVFQFYHNLGFEKICNRELWEKTWQP